MRFLRSLYFQECIATERLRCSLQMQRHDRQSDCIRSVSMLCRRSNAPARERQRKKSFVLAEPGWPSLDALFRAPKSYLHVGKKKNKKKQDRRRESTPPPLSCDPGWLVVLASRSGGCGPVGQTTETMGENKKKKLKSPLCEKADYCKVSRRTHRATHGTFIIQEIRVLQVNDSRYGGERRPRFRTPPTQPT